MKKNISMDDNINLLFEAVLKNIYKNHPYGQQSILGSVEHLKNPSLKKMYQFFNDYYVANIWCYRWLVILIQNQSCH